MAFSVIRAENGGDATQGFYYEYLCESADDVANLPTTAENGGPRPGSLAYIESDSAARYILKIGREWGEYPMASGGGGGNSGIMMVDAVYNDDTGYYDLSQTCGTIVTALKNKTPVFVNDYYGDITADPATDYADVHIYRIVSAVFNSGVYYLAASATYANAAQPLDPMVYYAASLDGYPTSQAPGG